MALRCIAAPSAVEVSSSFSAASLCSKWSSSFPSSSSSFSSRRGFPLQVQAKESLQLEPQQQLNGVVFEPFSEVKPTLTQISSNNSKESLARQCYSAPCEAAINEQINVEYNFSYIYHALYAYFDRDNVALPGLAKFFKESSDEERQHAEMFMKYQDLRGGRVKLQTIMAPEMEFDHSEKGDALYAMELALSLEKLNYEKLLNLTKIAEEEGDPQMQDFIENNFLVEQVEAIRKISEYVSELRRVGKGHGVYHFDLQLSRALAQN